jgi:thiamine biosynthesis lipoprotein
MASPCEVLMEVDDRQEAERILSAVAAEARRVERKFSRYLPDNPIFALNHSEGTPVEVDEETARLLDFAERLWELSEGRFDITSGALRRVWNFDGGDRVPQPEQVRAVLRQVGWERVSWDGRRIALQRGMEIDLGGIGKEYAVDRAVRDAAALSGASCLVNFGGDIAITRSRRGGAPWRVGIDDGSDADGPVRLINLLAGGLATSGDARRYVLRDGIRYGHILDARTGWPVAHAPCSVTVAAGSCVEAGMLCTLAMMHGAAAASFLEAQGARFWVSRRSEEPGRR